MSETQPLAPAATRVAVFFTAPEDRLERLQAQLVAADGTPSMDVLLPCPGVLTALVEREAESGEGRDDGAGGENARPLRAYLREFLYATPVGGNDYWLADFPARGCDPTNGAFARLYGELRGRDFASEEETLRDFRATTGGIHNPADWRHEHWGTVSDWCNPVLMRGWIANRENPDAGSALCLRASVVEGEPVAYLQAVADRFPDVDIRCLALGEDGVREHVFRDGALTSSAALEPGESERAFLSAQFGA